MPSLSELPSNINSKKLTKALKCLGFIISTKGGKGSHIKATHTKTQKCIIIPKITSKIVLKYLIKEIEKCSPVTWEDIKEKL